MTGEQIKQVLIDNKYQLKDIAEKLGTSLSNLSAGLSKSDIRTGLLEKISEVSGLPISVFYGGSFGPVQTAVGDNNTQVGGDYQASNPDVLELLKKKDEQLMSTHAGRRTFISNALMMGIPPNVVMRWTGHADYNSMKPYIAIADSVKVEEMSKFNKK